MPKFIKGDIISTPDGFWGFICDNGQYAIFALPVNLNVRMMQYFGRQGTNAGQWSTRVVPRGSRLEGWVNGEESSTHWIDAIGIIHKKLKENVT